MADLFEEPRPYSPPRVKPLTVTQLTSQLKDLVEQIGSVWLRGEISNLRCPTSGHIYLTLKDQESQVAAIIWRTVAVNMGFELRDGMAVLVLGQPTVYGPQGRYQILITTIEPEGLGPLQRAFARLRKRLSQEGLFDPSRKRPLPLWPRRLGIITSPKSAAIQDILNVIERRCPRVSILIYPTRVQGREAGREIVQGITIFNRFYQDSIDVIIVGRGGGSSEDLWAFNEEIVARSIASSQIPVISAVGHETDVTIADLVADRRALTPSEAAEIAVPRLDVLQKQLAEQGNLLHLRMQQRLTTMRARLERVAAHCVLSQPLDAIRRIKQNLDYLAQRLSNCLTRRCYHLEHHLNGLATRLAALRPAAYLARQKEYLTGLQTRQTRAMQAYFTRQEDRLATFAARLSALSPLQVLQRGYSITQSVSSQQVLLDSRKVLPGEHVRTRLAQGWILAKVEKTWPG